MLISQAKLALALINKKKIRDEESLFVAEGEKLVEEAIKFGEVEFTKKGYSKMKFRVYKISSSEMKKLSLVETPQGVLAVCRKTNYKISNLLNLRKPSNPLNSLILLPIEIQDPGNLGTMIRVVDAVGASGIIVSKGTVDPYNPKVVRSTMGSIFRVPIVEIDNLLSVLIGIQDKGYRILGTDLVAKKTHWDIDYKQPTVLLIGNESVGLPSDILKICDDTVKIPIPGKAESLNAAMAASIILYEALRHKIF